MRSSTSVYNLSLMGSIIAADGAEKAEAWATGLVANFARQPEGGDTDQLKAVAAGVGDIAISNTYYLARLLASEKPEERAIGEKLGVFFPNQGDRGTHVNISGAGVLKYAPNKDNAIKLLEFLVSPEAQRYFADISFEYPVNPEVKPHPVLAAFGELQTGHAERRNLRGQQPGSLQDHGPRRLEVGCCALCSRGFDNFPSPARGSGGSFVQR